MHLSSSIAKRGDIRDFYNKPEVTIDIPEGGSRQATYFMEIITPDNQVEQYC